jgi:hypothetical protein
MTVTLPTCQAEALAFYAAYNLAVTPVLPGAKAGRLEGWSKLGHSATAVEFRPGNNVGVPKGICDCYTGHFQGIWRFDRRATQRSVPAA